MNQFQGIQSGQGMLKDFYESGDRSETALSSALKRKRNKLLATKGMEARDAESTGIVSQFNDSKSRI